MTETHSTTIPDDNSQRFTQPPAGHRDWYAFEAIRALPRIVLMIDKNPFSPTYGCFDREFWHYRTADFPCGMSQEFCLALAMATKTPMPQNPFYANKRLHDLCIASMEFAARWSHQDGSCDDYFPFEKALGAVVFSTYAMTESYLLLGVERPDLLSFFKKRGDWLRHNNESGQLANHQALAALALYNIFLLTEDRAYLEASNSYRDIALSWQNREGWFQEYEGADPGYHSCTIAFLSKLLQKSGDQDLIEPLKRACEFAAFFMHPDGSYGGEYGSRNTYHFYPHGFEVMACHSEAAARVAQTYLAKGLPDRRRYYNDDNRMCAHYVYDWMQAWRDYSDRSADTINEQPPSNFERWFSEAGLFVKKTPNYYAVLSLTKGGVLKVFDNQGPLYSDTGLMARTKDGHVLVSHLVDDHEVHVDLAGGQLTASGYLSKRKHRVSSPSKQIAFRTMNLSIGRADPQLVRKTLQKVLITGKPRTSARFRRSFIFEETKVIIRDSLDLRNSDLQLERLGIVPDATSIYVANSNTFQESMLLPCIDLSEHVNYLNEHKSLELPAREVLAR